MNMNYFLDWMEVGSQKKREKRSNFITLWADDAEYYFFPKEISVHDGLLLPCLSSLVIWLLSLRKFPSVIYNWKVPIKVKEKFDHAVIRPTMLKGPLKMIITRRMCGHTTKNKLHIEHICERVKVRYIEEEMAETRFKWFSHIHSGPLDVAASWVD